MSDKTKILIVEDEPDVMDYLTVMFNENGYETVSAATGVEALKQLKSERPDLVTLDMVLPEKTGVKFYREMRDNPDFEKVPVVVVTGIRGYGNRPEEFKRFLDTRSQFPPPDAFIAKPFDREELLETVRKLISQKSTV